MKDKYFELAVFLDGTIEISMYFKDGKVVNAKGEVYGDGLLPPELRARAFTELIKNDIVRYANHVSDNTDEVLGVQEEHEEPKESVH